MSLPVCTCFPSPPLSPPFTRSFPPTAGHSKCTLAPRLTIRDRLRLHTPHTLSLAVPSAIRMMMPRPSACPLPMFIWFRLRLADPSPTREHIDWWPFPVRVSLPFAACISVYHFVDTHFSQTLCTLSHHSLASSESLFLLPLIFNNRFSEYFVWSQRFGIEIIFEPRVPLVTQFVRHSCYESFQKPKLCVFQFSLQFQEVPEKLPFCFSDYTSFSL